MASDKYVLYVSTYETCKISTSSINDITYSLVYSSLSVLFFLSLGFAFGLLIFSFHTSGHKSGRNILPNIQTLFLENVA